MAQAFRRVPWVEWQCQAALAIPKGFTPKKRVPRTIAGQRSSNSSRHGEKVLRFLWKILALAPFLSAIHERDQCHSDINWYVRMDL
jgi:hypothetical protein